MKNLIIDCNNLLYRVFWINKNNTLFNSKGQNVASILFFLKGIKAYADMYTPDNIYACWDKKLIWPSSNFRKETQVTYKGNRDKEKFVGVHDFDDVIQEMLDCLNVNNIYPNVMEADDLIAWLSDKLEGHTTIVSTDRDLWQLIRPSVRVYSPLDKKEITEINFEEHANIPLKHFIRYKSIIGDNSDNIKGVEGYGKVKGKKLALTWDESTITDEIRKVVDENTKLIDLRYGYNYYSDEVPIYQKQLNAIKKRNTHYNFDKFKYMCDEYEMPSVSNNLHYWENTFKNSARSKVILTNLIEKLNIHK